MYPRPSHSLLSGFVAASFVLSVLSSCENTRVIAPAEEPRAPSALSDASIDSGHIPQGRYLSGKVLDRRNNPVAGVIVRSIGLGVSDTTKIDGAWYLPTTRPPTSEGKPTGNDPDTIVFSRSGSQIHRMVTSIDSGSLEPLRISNLKFMGSVAKGDFYRRWPSTPESLSLVVGGSKSAIFGFDSATRTFSRSNWLVSPQGGGKIALFIAAWSRQESMVGTSDTLQVDLGTTDSIRFKAVSPLGGFRPPPAAAIRWVSDSAVRLDTMVLRVAPVVSNGETIQRVVWYYSGTASRIGTGDTLRWRRPDLPKTDQFLVAWAWFSSGDSTYSSIDLPYWKKHPFVKIDSIQAIPGTDSVEVFSTISTTDAPPLVMRWIDIEGKAFSIPKEGRIILPVNVGRPGKETFNLHVIDEAGDTSSSSLIYDVKPDLRLDSIVTTPTHVRVVVSGRSIASIDGGSISVGRGSCSLLDSNTCVKVRSTLDPQVKVEVQASWRGGSPWVRIDSILPTPPPYKLFIDTANDWLGMNPWMWMGNSAQTWSGQTPSYSVESKSKTGRILPGPVLQISWLATNKGGMVSHVWPSTAYSASGDLQFAYDNDSLDILVAIGTCGTDADFDNGWMRGWKIPSKSHGEVRITPDSLQWFRIPASDPLQTYPKPPRDVERFKTLMSDCYTFHFAMTCGNMFTACGHRQGVLEIGDIQLPNPGAKP